MVSLSDPFNLVLLVLAVALAWKMWSVLGKRTGYEKPPIISQPPVEKPGKSVEPPVLQGEVLDPEDSQPVWQGHAEAGSTLALGLEGIASKSPGFTAAAFVRGAGIAYEMVLEAYAKSDKAALKPLLNKELFDSFAGALDARKAAGQTTVFQFVGVKKASLKRAVLQGNKAQIDVDFISEMISATLDKTGTVVDGDDKSIRAVTDLWTFERDVTSKDPNWKLIATDDNG